MPCRSHARAVGFGDSLSAERAVTTPLAAGPAAIPPQIFHQFFQGRLNAAISRVAVLVQISEWKANRPAQPTISKFRLT